MDIQRQFPGVHWIWGGGISFVYEVHPLIVVKVPKFGEFERKQFEKELEIYRIFSQNEACPFIVECFYFSDNGIFLEYMRDKSLSSRIQSNHIRDQETMVVTKVEKLEPLLLRAEWMNDLAQAVAFLESLNLAHGDLRPENILLDRNRLRLSDFDCTAEIGTQYEACMAPYGRILNTNEPDQGECGTFGLLGPRTEQFALGSLYYFMNYGFEVYGDRCLTEDPYDHGPKVVDLLQDMEFPKLDGNPLIDNIIDKCWHNKYVTVSELAAHIEKLLTEGTDTPRSNGRMFVPQNANGEVTTTAQTNGDSCEEVDQKLLGEDFLPKRSFVRTWRSVGFFTYFHQADGNREQAKEMANPFELSYSDFTVGWICALPIEMAAAQAMMDETVHPRPVDSTEGNNYSFGRIAAHNVVIACLPAGITGTVSAARVASQLIANFPALKFGLMVGIGGGVPSGKRDIRLGDVVVSQPTGPYGGVIQYDFGKTVRDGKFLRTGTLNKPPDMLLTALSKLQSNEMLRGLGLSKKLAVAAKEYPRMKASFSPPEGAKDLLFGADYQHAGENADCAACDARNLVHRTARESDEPRVHYGLIASGDQVLRHGATREQLRKDLDDVLCFEMEAAGLMDSFPCLVIRGICDYADSHKNKDWQPYAAAVAAAYASEVLHVIGSASSRNAGPLAYEYPVDGSSGSNTMPLPSTSFRAVSRPVSDWAESEEREPWPQFQTERPALTPKFLDRGGSLTADCDRWFSEVRKSPWTLVVYGLGGVGKSQLCLKVILGNEGKFRHVFYVDASSMTTADSSFLEISRICGLRTHWDDMTSDEQVRLTRSWLSRQKDPSLLFLDNADSPDFDLTRYTPRGGPWTIIITTTDERLATGSSVFVKLGPMDSDAAVDLLMRYKRPDTTLTRSERKAAKHLAVDLLGGLPLAIAQAGSYIFNKRCTYQSYCDEYQASPQGPLSYELGPWCTHQTIWKTLRISLDRIHNLQQEGAAEAVDLLRTFCFMHHEAIHTQLFREAWRNMKNAPEWSQLVTLLDPESSRWDCAKIQAALEILWRYSLISPGDQQYSVHRLVHVICRESLSQQERDRYLLQAMSILAIALSGIRTPLSWIESPSGLPLQRALLPHIRTCLDNRRYVLNYDGDRNHQRVMVEMLLQIAKAYTATGHVFDGQRLLQELRDVVNANPENKAYQDIEGHVLGHLATCKDWLGQHRDACQLRKRVLELEKKTHSDPDDVLIAMMNLASSLWHVGQRKEALEMSQAVLDDRERKLSPTDPKLRRTRRKVAQYLHWSNKRREALDLREKALLGTGPPATDCEEEYLDTLATKSALSESYQWDGRLLRSLELQQEVYDARLRILGPEHPDTLLASDRLIGIKSLFAKTAEEQREICESRELAVSTWKRVFGERHPYALEATVNLGHSYSVVRDWSKALEVQRAVLEIRRELLTEQGLQDCDPSYLSSMGNVANLLSKMGNHREAISMREKALKLSKRYGGPQDPTTFKLTHRLCDCYKSLDTAEARQKALKMRRSLLDDQRTWLQEDDPNVLITMSFLADDLLKVGSKIESLELRKNLLEKQKAILGERNRESLETMKRLALAMASGVSWVEHRDAITLMERAAAIETELLGEEHLQTRKTKVALYWIYREARDNKNARKLAVSLQLQGDSAHIGSRDLYMISTRDESDLETDAEETASRMNEAQTRMKRWDVQEQTSVTHAPPKRKRKKKRKKLHVERNLDEPVRFDDVDWVKRLFNSENQDDNYASSSEKYSGESGSEAKLSPGFDSGASDCGS